MDSLKQLQDCSRSSEQLEGFPIENIPEYELKWTEKEVCGSRWRLWCMVEEDDIELEALQRKTHLCLTG